MKKATTPQSEVQKETDSAQPETQSSNQVQSEEQTPPDQNKTSGCQGSARTQRCIKVQPVTKPVTESQPAADLQVKPKPLQTAQPASQSRGLRTRSQTATQTQNQVQRPEKRKSELEGGHAAKKSSSTGLEPVVAQSTKPWPVFTIASSGPARDASEVDRYGMKHY